MRLFVSASAFAALVVSTACAPAAARKPPAVAAPGPAASADSAAALERLARNPDDVEARLALAEARRKAGDAEGALVEIYKAIASDPKSEAAQIARARLYFDRGLVEKEIDAWRAALDLAPDDAEARENLGHALLAGGHDGDAAQEYRRVLEARPDARAALFNLAQLETRAGHTDTARDLWNRYLQLDPDGPWADKAREAVKVLSARKAGP